MGDNGPERTPGEDRAGAGPPEADEFADEFADEINANDRTVVQSSGIVAVGTLLSRATGFLRTLLLVYTIGAAGAAEAYNLANTTPNLLYDLLLGGVLSATLIPVLVANRERNDAEATDAVMTVSVVVLVAITLVGFVLAPVVIHLYAALAAGAGHAPSPAQQDLTTTLLRLFVPQILFYGLTTLGSSLLNTHRRFTAAAFAPVVNNVVMMMVLITANFMISGKLTVDQLQQNTALVLVLGGGTTAGIMAMSAVLWPAIRRAGIPLHWRTEWRHPAVIDVIRLAGWTFGYVIANQVAFFILTGLISGSNGVSAWNYAYQFFQLPYGVITVSIMTAFTPELSTLFARGERPAFNDRFLQGIRLQTVLLLPAMVLFVALAIPMVSFFYEHGEQFTSTDTLITASTVAALAWGMIGFSLYLYVLRAFYTMKDTKTPFLINLVENAVALALGFVLIPRLGVSGLAWSWSLAYSLAAAGAFVVLQRRIGPFGRRTAVQTTAPVARMVVAALAMAITVVLVSLPLPRQGWAAAGSLAISTLVGVAVYGGVLFVLKVNEIREVGRLLLRRGS